jgi:hypothetical protein
MLKIEATKGFAPRLKFVDSSTYVDSNQRTKFVFQIKPDVTCYEDPTDEEKTNSATAEIFIEFKWSNGDDPFCSVKSSKCANLNCLQEVDSFLNHSKAAMDTLGQITSYAAAQLGAQFRTHAYSVLIVKDQARILRWDRSGTIVTEAIKYNESPHLAEFFRRYSVAPDVMRGKDETVSVPSRFEKRTARKALGLDAATPLVKLSVPGPDESLRYFVVPTPETTPYTPPGRATRGFGAYDISRSKVVFLKDTWRIDLDGITPEGEVYAKLNAASVRNIPQCLASGDISSSEYHATRTPDYAQSSWASKGCSCHPSGPWIPHRHFRLVLDVYGRSLVDYESSHEMVSAIRDALYGEFL